MTDHLFVLRNGRYVQVRDDGRDYKVVDSPDTPLDPGWHYMIKGEFGDFDIVERCRELVESRITDTN